LRVLRDLCGLSFLPKNLKPQRAQRKSAEIAEKELSRT